MNMPQRKKWTKRHGWSLRTIEHNAASQKFLRSHFAVFSMLNRGWNKFHRQLRRKLKPKTLKIISNESEDMVADILSSFWMSWNCSLSIFSVNFTIFFLLKVLRCWQLSVDSDLTICARNLSAKLSQFYLNQTQTELGSKLCIYGRAK